MTASETKESEPQEGSEYQATEQADGCMAGDWEQAGRDMLTTRLQLAAGDLSECIYDLAESVQTGEEVSEEDLRRIVAEIDHVTHVLTTLKASPHNTDNTVEIPDVSQNSIDELELVEVEEL